MLAVLCLWGWEVRQWYVFLHSVKAGLRQVEVQNGRGPLVRMQVQYCSLDQVTFRRRPVDLATTVGGRDTPMTVGDTKTGLSGVMTLDVLQYETSLVDVRIFAGVKPNIRVSIEVSGLYASEHGTNF